jgi:ribosomal subunit interface protein
MQKPLRITYRHMKKSDALEATLREHVDHLARVHDQFIACDVVVTAPAGRHQNGEPFDVRIHLTVPDGDLNVRSDSAHADVYFAARDAFGALERMLRKYLAGRQRAREHESIRRTEPQAGSDP